MTRLADIPVRMEPRVRSGGLGGGVVAVLNEVLTLLEDLSSHGKTAVIDLRSLPMSPMDKADLQHFLGEGEVHATVNADGPSSIRETLVSGVWWIEHRDQQGEMIAELLEVSTFPQFLAAGADDVTSSLREARRRLAGGDRPASARAIA
jgi:hydrogenase-1 operon protein HyaF